MIDWIESKLEMDEHFRHIRALQEEMERRAAEKRSLQKETFLGNLTSLERSKKSLITYQGNC